MQIRPFEPGDEDDVVSLWQACGLTKPWNDPHRDIARKQAVDSELFLVGTIGRCLVASVMAGYEGHRGWVNYLAVSPATRGCGHGAALMADVERRLLAIGCPKLNLQVRGSNADVIAFYQHLGYTVDDTVSLGKRLIADD